jgi:hypothetical protein
MDLKWRKSPRSSATGGACVELAVTWLKSSRSDANGGACVEVAVLDYGKGAPGRL